MAANYTASESAAIANEVLRAYPASVIQASHAMFNWQGSGLPTAWTTRVGLVLPLVSATRAGAATAVLKAANDVYKWGFGGKSIPPKIVNNPAFHAALNGTLIAFDGATPRHHAARESALASLLRIEGVGIATASKWICFLDQGRYGIFDSRVSIALRAIHVANNRAFPIVGRRAQAKFSAFRPDTHIVSNSARMARAYLDYLRVLSEVARASGLLPAEVEMALFTLGNVWADGQPTPVSLRHSMWS